MTSKIKEIKIEVTSNATASSKSNSSPSKVLSEDKPKKNTGLAKEINGPKGLEPTRYGDWEAKGRCCDF